MISKKNILDLKPRRDIYQFISDNPGLHITEINQRMNISRSALRHHLRYLIKFNLIKCKVERKNKRLYACNLLSTKDQELLGLLRQELPFKIIMYLLHLGYCSKTELAKDLEVYPSTIHFHIKKLLDMDIIEPVEVKDGKFVSYNKHKPVIFIKPVGREKIYKWKNSEIVVDIYKLLITHKKSMIDPNIIDTYIELTKKWDYGRVIGRKKPKRYLSFNSTIDNIIEIMEEIGHFPFHF